MIYIKYLDMVVQVISSDIIQVLIPDSYTIDNL